MLTQSGIKKTKLLACSSEALSSAEHKGWILHRRPLIGADRSARPGGEEPSWKNTSGASGEDLLVTEMKQLPSFLEKHRGFSRGCAAEREVAADVDHLTVSEPANKQAS